MYDVLFIIVLFMFLASCILFLIKQNLISGLVCVIVAVGMLFVLSLISHVEHPADINVPIVSPTTEVSVVTESSFEPVVVAED